MNAKISDKGQWSSDDPVFRTFIIDSLPVGVLTVDSELRITSFNPWAEKITGYLYTEVQGKFCGDILHGEKCGVWCPLKTIISRQNPILRLESTIQNREGLMIPVRMNTAALISDKGELLGAVEAFQDISYLKALEREKDNFVSMAAHDMRSSLSIMGGFALQLLRNDDQIDNNAKNRYLNVIKKEAEKLEKLIDEFLEFSRLRTGNLKINPAAASIDKLLFELREAYEPGATEMGIKLHLQSECDLPLIEADSRQLRKAFANLLDNAIKFSKKGGTITISAYRIGREIMIEVRDEGIGISPEELPNIFDAFHRGKVGEKIKGYGLGLASVKVIVEAHKGKVLVESEKGKGSIFKVSLPVYDVDNKVI
jgi:PAS domain S-box-containing protein